MTPSTGRTSVVELLERIRGAGRDESEPILVAVAGAGAAGKSTLARAIQQLAPNEVTVIELDDFYRPSFSHPAPASTLAQADHQWIGLSQGLFALTVRQMHRTERGESLQAIATAFPFRLSSRPGPVGSMPRSTNIHRSMWASRIRSSKGWPKTKNFPVERFKDHSTVACRDRTGFGSLESVSCEESKTPEPPKLVFYDCQVMTGKNGEMTCCVIDSPAGMGPLPMSCAATFNEESVVVSQKRPGETKFTRSVKVRNLVPAPFQLPGAEWRSSMQASIGVEADGTVDLLTGDYVTGNLDLYLARSTDHWITFPGSQQANLTHDASDEVMPWLSVRPGGRLDIISYDYHRNTALMDVFYGQVADGATTMSRTYVASGINGNIQPPGSTPFMGDYIGIDSLADRVALSWTGNGPASQDVFSAVLTP
jgi:hypothetical protein